eukprot:scaffold1993_cov147-Skeletonema_dohrnii-CCMP3373.AAC.2
MNSQPDTLSNTVSDEHVSSPLPALPSPVLSPSTKFGEEVSLLDAPSLNAPVEATAADVEMANMENVPFAATDAILPPAAPHPNVAALPPAPPAQQPPAVPSHFFGGNFRNVPFSATDAILPPAAPHPNVAALPPAPPAQAQQPPARPSHFFDGNFSDSDDEFDGNAAGTSDYRELARQIGLDPNHIAIYDVQHIITEDIQKLFPFVIHVTPPNGEKVSFTHSGTEFIRGVRYGIDNGYVNEGANVDLSFLGPKSQHLVNAIACANSMGYPEGEFAVIEKTFSFKKKGHTKHNVRHTTIVVSLKTCDVIHGKNAHKEMCDAIGIDLYTIQSPLLVRHLQDAAAHGLPPHWLYDDASPTSLYITSPNGDIIHSIVEARELCNVCQPDYLREAITALKRVRQQTLRSFYSDVNWSAGAANENTFYQVLRSVRKFNYTMVKDLIKYLNFSVRDEEYAGCADLAGLVFCLNKRLRVGNAVPDDVLSSDDVRLGSLNIGVIELDEVGRDGVIYHPFNSDQAEYESMGSGSDYSGLTEGTIVVAKINSLVDENDDAIDESNEAFMLLRYIGCYVDGDDKLFVALTVPATNEDGEDDEYYLIAGEDEDLETTVKQNLFIFTCPGTSLPFYDEEGDTVHVRAADAVTTLQLCTWASQLNFTGRHSTKQDDAQHAKQSRRASIAKKYFAIEV